MREETQHSGTRQGALTALAATGGVIISAGAVLVTARTMDLGRRMWWPSRLSRPEADPALQPALTRSDVDAGRARECRAGRGRYWRSCPSAT